MTNTNKHTPAQILIHPFQDSGLGKAPFIYTHMTGNNMKPTLITILFTIMLMAIAYGVGYIYGSMERTEYHYYDRIGFEVLLDDIELEPAFYIDANE